MQLTALDFCVEAGAIRQQYRLLPAHNNCETARATVRLAIDGAAGCEHHSQPHHQSHAAVLPCGKG